ncbi:hypothetical protein CCC_00625 [Paramagnetospirillum magnetotacticum MS-1]|uniref:Uncharacterized protein n=1 Tax=Paramagnetospirillum magnetotacticum MS-1 TaxID=272627 RepID=A0A0C2YCZ0_PARME|nr:hypothetical protein [Paramagnetospirillum magnetotacticum]KIL97564.1 hypothetical protein CCC_00625 [Paramagnetospirillum magnetotacticum MS-1]
MSVAKLPPPVEIDTETKKGVIEGLKKVLATFQQAGLVEPAVTYQQVISDPDILQFFIKTFQAKRDMVDDIVRAKEGKDPVRDESTPLVCGISLGQIQQLLVRTCAKKIFEADKPMETITETVTTKSMFGLIKKTEQVERQAVDPVEERKVRELSRYIAFGWQLPLLEVYRSKLSYPQIIEIGEDIVALPTAAHIEAVAKFEPDKLKKVKAAVGSDFGAVLAERPQAIGGISVWNRDMFEFFRKTLGDHAWTFFARDQAFFNVCAALDKSVAKIFGDMLCYIAAENLQEIQRLNIDKVEVMVHSLKTGFGPRAEEILAIPAFAKDILRKVVDNLLHMTQEKDKLMLAFGLSIKAMVPAVDEWLAKRH